MGVRGVSELLAELPPAAASCLASLDHGIDELLDLRLAPLAPEQVGALAEVVHRLEARLTAGRLSTLAAIDARDDVVPKARPGHAAAVFRLHVLRQSRARARREAHTAALLRPEVGDLPRMGAALSAGDIASGHVDVAVRAHRDLGQATRDKLIPYDEIVAAAASPVVIDGVLRPDPAVTDDLAAAFTEMLADPSGPSGLGGAGGSFATPPASVRQVLLVDAVLVFYARRMDVDCLEAVAHRIVEALNPKTPKGAHERRYLHMSRTPDGAWRGRFECGSAQGAFIKAVLAAFAAPRAGAAIDADGVERALPDERDFGARQMDAVADIFAAALAKNGITLPGPNGDENTTETTSESAAAGAQPSTNDSPRSPGAAPDGTQTAAQAGDAAAEDLPEPPTQEGEFQVIREPGVLAGPLPAVELIVSVGIEHLAAAFGTHLAAVPANDQRACPPLGLDVLRGLQDWVSQHPWGQPPDHHSDARNDEQLAAAQDGASQDAARRDGAYQDGTIGPAVTRFARALSPLARPARVEHAGMIDAATLRFLADCAQIRIALLSPDGAVLHLGRTQRLASATQKRALIARDAGCVIPGCVVTADACQAHHVVPWTEGGPTDLDNLALLCFRHHAEVTATGSGDVARDGWQIEMVAGVPWVRPPSWVDVRRPQLRNAVHHLPHQRGDEL